MNSLCIRKRMQIRQVVSILTCCDVVLIPMHDFSTFRGTNHSFVFDQLRNNCQQQTWITKRICVDIFYNMNIRLSSVLHMVNCCNTRGSRQTNKRSVCRLLLFMFLRLHMQSIQCHDLSWLSAHPESLYRCPSFCRCPWSEMMPCIWTSLPCYIECVAAQACLIPNFESNDVIFIKEMSLSLRRFG